MTLVFALMFIGGLSRFTMLRPEVTLAPPMLPSLFVELILMPIFVVWLARSVRGPTSKADPTDVIWNCR